MEIMTQKQSPQRSLKRSLIVFIGNILGIYLIGFFGLGVEIIHFGDILLLVIYISFIMHCSGLY